MYIQKYEVPNITFRVLMVPISTFVKVWESRYIHTNVFCAIKLHDKPHVFTIYIL